MSKIYFTKLSVCDCEKALEHNSSFVSENPYGSLNVKQKNEAIFFKFHFYKASPKISLQFGSSNSETLITLGYKPPFLFCLGFVSAVFITLISISMMFSDSQAMKQAGVYGTIVFCAVLLLSCAGFFAMKKTSFKIAENYIKSILGGQK